MLGDQISILTWGDTDQDHFLLRGVTKNDQSTYISLTCAEGDVEFSITFTDDASVENAIHCCCVMLRLRNKTGADQPAHEQAAPGEYAAGTEKKGSTSAW